VRRAEIRTPETIRITPIAARTISSAVMKDRLKQAGRCPGQTEAFSMRFATTCDTPSFPIETP
jgi:hypothetical protein